MRNKKAILIAVLIVTMVLLIIGNFCNQNFLTEGEMPPQPKIYFENVHGINIQCVEET